MFISKVSLKLSLNTVPSSPTDTVTKQLTCILVNENACKVARAVHVSEIHASQDWLFRDPSKISEIVRNLIISWAGLPWD